jgi:histidinol-phosphate aminotransferase
MDSTTRRSTGPISRRRFLGGAAAGAGTLALADRLALAQTLVGGQGLTASDIRGWGEVPGVVDIGDNENPFGPSPMAVRAVAERIMDVNRYDFGSSRELANAIGRYHGFPEPPPPAHRFASSGYPVYVEGGSSFILRLIAERFGVRGGTGEIIEANPGYGGVTRFIQSYRDRVGAEVTLKRVPTTADFRHDLDAMLAAVTPNTTLVIITNPNNPTGTIVPQADLERFVAALPRNVMVLIDEAYIHFVREPGYGDSIALTQRYKNVVVTRTFSKVFGLAGLRVGYAVADAEVVDTMRFFGNGGGIGSVNCYAAAAALEDHAFVRRVRRTTNNVKDYFYAELDKLGLAYTPSDSSFVLVDAGRDGAALQKSMAARKIMLSRLGMDGNAAMKNHIRFSMGTPEEIEVAVAAFRSELSA